MQGSRQYDPADPSVNTSHYASMYLVNDGGGRIFERLPQKETMSPGEFERLMLTPGEVEASTLAATWGIPATRVDDSEALIEALEHPGPLVIEAFPVA